MPLTSPKRLLHGPAFRLPFSEPWLFALLCLVGAIPFVITRWVPCLDGPEHLHNAMLLKNMLSQGGHWPLHLVYEFVPVPLPNYGSHALLLFFLLALPPWLALKGTQMACAALVLFGLRRYAGTFGAERRWMVFPFALLAVPGLLSLGFFNMCLGVGCIFWGLAAHRRWLAHGGQLHLAAILFWVTAGYFCHLMPWAYLLACLAAQAFSAGTQGRVDWKRFGREFGWLALAALPSVLCMVWYMRSISMQAEDASSVNYPFGMKLNLLLISHEFSWVDRRMETLLMIPVTLILIGLSVWVWREGFKQRRALPLLFLLGYAATVLLYFLLPNDFLVGMMTDRLKLFVPLMLALVCLSLPLPVRLMQVCALAGVVSFSAVSLWRIAQVRRGDAIMRQCEAAGAHLPENATVQFLNECTYWPNLHFYALLATHHSLVLPGNYEADCGWFPLKWRAGYPAALRGLPCAAAPLPGMAVRPERYVFMMLQPEGETACAREVQAKGKCVYRALGEYRIEVWRMPNVDKWPRNDY